MDVDGKTGEFNLGAGRNSVTPFFRPVTSQPMLLLSKHLTTAAGGALVMLASCQRTEGAPSRQRTTRGGIADNASPAGGIPKRRGAALPTCDSVGVMCFRDTAFAHTYPGDPAPIKDKWWILFGSVGDSIEIRVSPEAGGGIQTNLGQERDARDNNVPYFRARLSSDGVVETWVVVDGANMLGDTVPYVLSLRRLGKDAPWLRATGQRATLSVVSASDRDRFAVLPLTVARSVRDMSPWTVHAGTYNFALVPDSLYKVCKLPCVSADTVKLLPRGKASVKYQVPPSR